MNTSAIFSTIAGSPASLQSLSTGGLVVTTAEHGRADGAWRATAPDTWEMTDSGGSLELQLNIQRYPAHGAAVVRCRIRNRAATALTLTGVAVHLDLAHDSGPWQVCSAAGGGADQGYPSANYAVREQTLFGDGAVRLGTDLDGRSSNRNLPMVLVCRSGGEGDGLWCGLEWSAEWLLEVYANPSENLLRIVTAIGVRRLRLDAGEELLFPPIHLGTFTGGLAAGGNALRRYIYQTLQPKYRGEAPYGRVSYSSFFGLGSDINDALMRRQAARAAELGIEVFEVDAGYNGEFPRCGGEWNDVDRRKFPDGLEPVADYVRSLGMDFGLWVEPERVYRGTWAHRRHPELYWPDPGGRDEFLVDLSRREGQDWSIEWMSDWLGRLRASWVRFDQNVPAGIFLNSQDWSRKIQFVYVAGIYRVMDALLARFPDLMIENCASGGRRIDFGTLRRSHTNWMSDYSGDAHTCRWMILRMQRFLPGNNCNSGIGHLPPGRQVPGHGIAFGGGPVSTDEIDLAFLSRIIGKVSIDGDIAALDAAAVERYRHWIAVHKRIRHLVVQDFHQLLPTPVTLDAWDAAQWSAYDGAEGLLACYRVSGPTRRTVPLVGLEPTAHYRLTDLATGGELTTTGADLMSGVPVTMPAANAVLYKWERDMS